VITDKIGQEIKHGSYIVYAHAMGRSAGLRMGIVIADPVHYGPGELNRWEEYDQYRIKVRGVDGEWNHREAQLLSKNSTLQYPDRMVVVQPDTLPDNIREMLEEVYIEQKVA
tara:strand:+ start:899 stop:1234 length:336 start_codon:yes stop_codon:yes gene_type:complete